MSTSQRLTASEELEHIEDALIETLLSVSGEELRAEMTAVGIDPDTSVAEMDSAIAAARAKFSRERLKRARAAIDEWRAKRGPISGVEREAARARLQSGDHVLDEKLTMAARKGEGLSERDFDGLLEDLAELERLQSEDGNE